MNKNDFTHTGWFYFVPVYLNLEDENEPIISGRNLVFDWLLVAMTAIHNQVVERFTQMLAAVIGRDYEPGFPVDRIYEIEQYEANT